MISRFKDVVNSIARANKIALTASENAEIWDINKKLDQEEMDLAQAMSMLRGRMGIKFTEDDYRKVKKEMRYNHVK